LKSEIRKLKVVMLYQYHCLFLNANAHMARW